MADMIDLGALLPTGYAPPDVQGILGGALLNSTCTGNGTSPFDSCNHGGGSPYASCHGTGGKPIASCYNMGTSPRT